MHILDYTISHLYWYSKLDPLAMKKHPRTRHNLRSIALSVTCLYVVIRKEAIVLRITIPILKKKIYQKKRANIQ